MTEFHEIDDALDASVTAHMGSLARLAQVSDMSPEAFCLGGIIAASEVDSRHLGAEHTVKTLRQLADSLERDGKLLEIQTPNQH